MESHDFMACIKNGEQVMRAIDYFETVPDGRESVLPVVRPVPRLREGERLQWVEGGQRPHIIDTGDV